MCIHRRGGAKRLLQPDIIASGQPFERDATNLTELANVVLERFVAKDAARLGTKRERGLP